MNKENDYSKILAQANQDLKPFFVDILVYAPDNAEEYDVDIRLFDEDWSVKFFNKYASCCYIDELPDIITEAWADAKKNAMQARREIRERAKEETAKRFTLTNDMHLLGESIQEITLDAWPIIYGPENEYDQDSRVVLETIRDWAEEFERWWMSHSEDWRDHHDYLEEIDKFSDRKCKEYLEEIGVDPEARETKIFDETGHLIAKTIENAPAEKGHIEETIDIMLDIASIYEDMFADEVCDRDVERTLTKEWGREFSKWWYCNLSDEERMNRDYFTDLEAFVGEKFKELKEPKQKDYIVQITRIEKYEGTVSVKATSKEEAEKKVKEAWGDGNHDEIYEDMTENINCDSQTYDAHEAQPGEKADFSI
ncbi:MAG: hypothetical protein J6Y20_04895 [Lachnospiraceae bacterium]|nr:hypothetical protein [Kiritimatiellia bacterium]MBP5461444.1 hypothetical protein [Lachnospiraceae bacterium]